MWVRLAAILLVAWVDWLVGGPWRWRDLKPQRTLGFVLSTWITRTPPLHAWLVLSVVNLVIFRRMAPREGWVLVVWALVVGTRVD